MTEALTEVFGGRGRIVFDGEIVALAQGSRVLQKRMNTLRSTTAVRRQVPVTYLPFDIQPTTGRSSLLLDIAAHRIRAATTPSN